MRFRFLTPLDLLTIGIVSVAFATFGLKLQSTHHLHPGLYDQLAESILAGTFSVPGSKANGSIATHGGASFVNLGLFPALFIYLPIHAVLRINVPIFAAAALLRWISFAAAFSFFFRVSGRFWPSFPRMMRGLAVVAVGISGTSLLQIAHADDERIAALWCEACMMWFMYFLYATLEEKPPVKREYLSASALLGLAIGGDSRCVVFLPLLFAPLLRARPATVAIASFRGAALVLPAAISLAIVAAYNFARFENYFGPHGAPHLADLVNRVDIAGFFRGLFGRPTVVPWQACVPLSLESDHVSETKTVVSSAGLMYFAPIVLLLVITPAVVLFRNRSVTVDDTASYFFPWTLALVLVAGSLPRLLMASSGERGDLLHFVGVDMPLVTLSLIVWLYGFLKVGPQIGWRILAASIGGLTAVIGIAAGLVSALC